MANWKALSVGYAPYTQDYSAPGDRRRFCYYAEKRGISYETADPARTYDLLVVSPGADITQWCRYGKGKTRVIYQTIDAYLSTNIWELKSAIRGTAKYVLGHHRHLEMDYRTAIKKMCLRADAVICSTEEQRLDVLPFCDNVHIILDFHTKAIRQTKQDYSLGGTFNLAWEGLGENVVMLGVIREALQEVSRLCPVSVHCVTDLTYRKMNGPVRPSQTRDLARRTLAGIRSYLYEWNEEMFAAICTSCDAAVVPVPLEVPLFRGKPENKLVLFWKMGLPTVVSASPANMRAMEICGQDLSCVTSADWVDRLTRLATSESERRRVGQEGRQFAEERYGEANMLKQWDSVFESVL